MTEHILFRILEAETVIYWYKKMDSIENVGAIDKNTWR